MNFLLFRLPNESQFRLIKNEEVTTSVASFFPFDRGEISKIYAKNITEVSEKEIVNILDKVGFPSMKSEINFPNKEEYLAKINEAIDLVKNKNWRKIVISRPILQEFEKFDLAQIYLQLAQKYPQTFCYVWVEEERVWLGATPELLGKWNRKNQVFETMSLAGTLPVLEEWTEKEIREQEAVTDYIADILNEYGAVEKSKTYDNILGNIKHLRTDFQVKIQEQDLENLITKLHPTPAVCGIPKQNCKEEILRIEGYDREYYSGYLKVEMNDEIYFFVNLRCIQMFDNKVVAYVGGGVNSQSISQKEWEETELKALSILGVMENF